MTLDADSIVDRRRLRRKLTFWRVCAILFVIVALIALGASLSGSGSGLAGRASPYIARVSIEGLIRNDFDSHEIGTALARIR